LPIELEKRQFKRIVGAVFKKQSKIKKNANQIINSGVGSIIRLCCTIGINLFIANTDYSIDWLDIFVQTCKPDVQ
jgi:hypothetical protein